MISVGIDIGSFSVKLAEIHAASKTYSLVRFQEYPLSTDLTKDKKIEVLDILRNIAASYDLENTTVVLSVPQNQVAIRLRQFPFKERFKIMKSIAFELEDDIPFSQDDAIFEAKLTRFIDNSSEVLASACPKPYIQERLELAKEAGLDPDIISIEGLALFNLFENWQVPPQQTSPLTETPEARAAEIMIDIGHTRTKVLIYSEGVLFSVRTLDWGGKNIADAISQKYGLHYIEGLKELQKKAFILVSADGATRDQVVFSDTIKNSIEPLAQEVRFTILETMAAHNLKLTAAHISGGPSQIKNLGAFLTQKWELPVNRFKHFQIYPSMTIENTPSIEALSPTAIGIAIEGLKRPINPAINLLRDEFEPQSENLKLFVEKWGQTLKLAAIAFCILLVYGFLRESYAITMAEHASEVLKDQAIKIADLKGRQANPRNVRLFIKRKKEEQNAKKIAGQVREINSAMMILTQIHQVSPGPKQMLVEIRKLLIDNEHVEIQGEVAEQGSVSKFKQALENVAMDGRVDAVSPALKPPPGKQAFGFKLKVDRKRGGA